MELIPKPHQTNAVESLLNAIDQGARRIILTSPTGGGKSFTIALAIRRLDGLGKRVQVYTNRKLLVEQTEKKLIEYKIDFGVRAAGYEQQHYYPIQLSSIQTEYQRVIKEKEGRWLLFDADVVFVDEGHMANNEQAQSLMRLHLEKGATIVYVTATPLDMEGMADHMIVAGTNSELRACGMLLPALVYGAPEPDFKRWKIGEGQELTEKQAREACDPRKIFGNIVEWYDRTNPERKPTVLFAPGLEESRWLAKHLSDTGITAAHVDGEDVYVDGKFYRSSPKLRDEILDRSRDGSIKVLCNRFVLREGVDAPWFAHGILATTFWSVQTFLQSVGRLLRSHPALSHVTIQDHGGNWYRWGSPNADRHWELEMTSRVMQGVRDERLREKKEREPCRCPKCGLILAGRTCTCGYKIDEFRRMRPIIQEDGSVVEHVGDIFIQRVRRAFRDTTKIWSTCYFRGAATRWLIDGKECTGAALMKYAKEDGCQDTMTMPYGPKAAAAWFRTIGVEAVCIKPGMTFNQVEALFFHENHYFPPRNLALQPAASYDWFRRVVDVPYHRLNAGSDKYAQGV